MKNDNYHLGQLNRPVSQIDIQRNMVGFVVDGHILLNIIIIIMARTVSRVGRGIILESVRTMHVITIIL